VRPGELETLPEKMSQEKPGLDNGRQFLAVDPDGDLPHRDVVVGDRGKNLVQVAHIRPLPLQIE
jgi:hypothetical protein